MEEQNFKIITAVYNAGDFFDRYVQSIARQEYENYQVIVVDDASNDGTRDRVKEACDKWGWTAVLNQENKGALYNQVHGIRALNPEPDDVLVFVDGDDQLAHREVLQRLASYYEDGETQLTYGQYQPIPQSATCTLAAKFPQDIIDQKCFRQAVMEHRGLYWNHLRTFKYEIFAQLEDNDFTDDFGRWYQTATDACLMYPCLELAAPNIKFIEEIMYLYTSDNHISDWRRWPRQCDRDHNNILKKLPKR